MAAHPVSDNILRLLARHIHSVEQLEILSLVSSDQTKFWTAAEVHRAIQSSEQSVSNCLGNFCRVGFLRSEGEGLYRFAPATPVLAKRIQELTKTYRERRVAIVELIYKQPSD